MKTYVFRLSEDGQHSFTLGVYSTVSDACAIRSAMFDRAIPHAGTFYTATPDHGSMNMQRWEITAGELQAKRA